MRFHLTHCIHWHHSLLITTIHHHQIIIIFYNTNTISTPIAPKHPCGTTRHIWHCCPPPARRSSSPAVPSQPPAYSSRFHINTPDSTPSRCPCQVDPPTEPPVFIQDTFQKGTFLHTYWKYCRIAVDFIYIHSSKNTIFHKNAYNTVYIEKTYIYKNSHFFNYYQKTHIYKKHHFVKIRVFFK
jgi:hypothetical protein